MEIQGTWLKDEDGYMEFSDASLQRYYESITDKYHQIYNQFLDEYDDEEEAHYEAVSAGYEMINDYKLIDGREQFATTYQTPNYVLEVWYELDEFTQKRIYDKGYVKICSKAS